MIKIGAVMKPIVFFPEKPQCHPFKDSKHIAIGKNHGNVLEVSDSTIVYDSAA